MNAWWRTTVFILFLLIEPSVLKAENHKNTIIYFGVTQPSIDLTVTDQGSVEKNAGYHEIHYEPRLPTIGLIGLTYGGVSLSASHDIGTTKETYVDYTDYSLSLFYSWFGIAASYTEFLRFRIDESSGFSGTLNPDEYERKDLAMRFYRADAYIFPLRWNFDFGASFDPSKEKSDGIGLGLIGSGNRTAIDTRFGLLPQAWKDAFGSDGAFVGGELTGLGVELALGGSLKLGPLYLALLLAGGEGQHSFSYRSTDFQRSGSGHQIILRERVDLGLVGKSLFCAVQFNSQSPDYELKYMTIASSRTELGFVSGYKW